MTATPANAERALHAALIQLKSQSEIATGKATIEAAVKRLVVGGTSESGARTLVARAVAELRRRGAISAEGPWQIWSLDDEMDAPREELDHQETRRD